MSELDNSLEDFQSTQLSRKKMRRSYLVTYSQADLERFPSRESFGQAVASAFDGGSGKVKVQYWACALENHEKGGQHYHVALKLSGPKRWFSVKSFLTDRYGVVANFSESHDNYYAAFKYISKSDKNVYLSDGHPNLKEIGSPKTKHSTRAYRKKHQINSIDSGDCGGHEQAGTSKQRKIIKPRRLTHLEVSEFMLENEIKTETELFARADEQKKAGKKELANFVLSKSPKALNDLICNTWKMEAASKKVKRSNLPRMDVIRERSHGDCDKGCGGVWLQCAQEVLIQNHVHPYVFSAALRELMVKGRGKHRNIIIVGPANCAKTFLLRPVEKVFETFANPSNDKYAWLGAENAEIIFLNDFRWSREMIAWKELLLLLEGQTVHLPAPKNHYSKDISISTDTPILATSKSVIRYTGLYNTTDPTENEMMDARWKVFEFNHQIPDSEQRDLVPCAKCFCLLALLGDV